MRKAISFLGFNPRGYARVRYAFDPRPGCVGGTYETEFFAEALVALYRPERLLVLLTPTAEHRVPEGKTESAWRTLQARLEGRVELVPVRGLPEGAGASEFWVLFDAVTGCIDPGDRVLFDITHGMRSLPVIGMAALLYLKSACRVGVEALLYGALEAARDGLVPVVDLTPLVTLMEWASAADTFSRAGDGAPLARALRPHLPELAAPLDRLSDALALARPAETVDAARQFARTLRDAGTAAPPDARPLRLLEPALRDAYLPLTGPDREAADDPRYDPATLWVQVRWHLGRGRAMQAAMLAREWVVTVECLRLGYDPTDRVTRLTMDKRISNHTHWHLHGRGPGDDDLDRLDGAGLRAGLWDRLAACRNDLVHCGMLDGSPSARETRQRLEQIGRHLTAFAAEAGVVIAPAG